ncbi:hypothetical protein FQA39_LY08947 [Lamprigera yunnana]|nr:hypothetical protein FQA39_LY08947 [Lamprigera yunnana]
MIGRGIQVFRHDFEKLLLNSLRLVFTKTLNVEYYKKYYDALNIPEDSDQEEIRNAYLSLVKRFHPDSKSGEADAKKFQEIDYAFHILTERNSKKRWQVEVEEEDQEETLKHIAPQHRQYLSHDGMGYGNPFQREKQYSQRRAIKASENIMQHRVQKAASDENSLATENKTKHKINTKYGFDRLVEDLIQEAISKGQFDNLSGFGKPLPAVDINTPYVDFVTHKLNQVLINNGFTPEWITLQKEIREETQFIRKSLILQRTNYPPCPLNEKEFTSWASLVEKYQETVNEINRKITKYNLLVPLLQWQMFFVNLEKEASKILLSSKSNRDILNRIKWKKKDKEESEETHNSLSSFIKMLFKRN